MNSRGVPKLRPGRLVELHVEPVEAEHEGRERLGVDPGAGRDGVVGAGRRGEAVALGEDDVAAPAEQVAHRHADDDARECEVEDEVAGLTQVAGLAREARVVVRVQPESLAPQHAPRRSQRLVGREVGDDLGVLVEPREPGGGARRGRRAAPRSAALVRGTMQPTSETNEQQVDRREPRRGVDVEEAEAVEPRRGRGVLRDVVGDAAGIDVALREDRARHGGDRQQQQQEERGAHARQLAPGPADPAERAELRQRRVGLRAPAGPRRGLGRHLRSPPGSR